MIPSSTFRTERDARTTDGDAIGAAATQAPFAIFFCVFDSDALAFAAFVLAGVLAGDALAFAAFFLAGVLAGDALAFAVCFLAGKQEPLSAAACARIASCSVSNVPTKIDLFPTFALAIAAGLGLPDEVRAQLFFGTGYVGSSMLIGFMSRCSNQPLP